MNKTIESEDKKYDVTVIVPCYNVEPFLAKCLDSLVAQTYKKLEVIMVEDFSTDNTRQIVRLYEKKYNNFKAIYNKENGGLGNARNVGIEHVKSKYVAFLDSDDWVPENYIEELHKTITSRDTDISVCDIVLKYDDKVLDQRVKAFNKKTDKYGLIDTGLSASSSAKLFKSKLFDNLKYPVDIVNEDIPVILALLHDKKIAYTSSTVFYYYQRPGSIQNREITEKRLDVFKSIELLKANISSSIDKRIWDIIVWQQAFAVLIYVLPKANSVQKRKTLIEKFYKISKNNGIEIDISNPGFRDFVSTTRVNRLYGKTLMRYFRKEHFLKASITMSVYAFLQNHQRFFKKIFKTIRMVEFLFKHPQQFLKKANNKIMKLSKRPVIRSGITIDHLVSEAKRQHSIRGNDPVSVVVPNYNYERYMMQRIYSILYQSSKVGEIIILDDVSSDDSVKKAEYIKESIGKYVPVRLINNKVNKGTFRQWELGFKVARNELIWIAEADDYSDKHFLKNAVGKITSNEDVLISYSNTGYTDERGVLLGNVRKDIDYRGTGHWDRDYVVDGTKEASEYSYINNTIANVSSVVFKRIHDIDYEELFHEARSYRQAGDWVFYVNYMTKGRVAYTNKVLNYYRMHGNNISSTTKANDHIKEILLIQKYFINKLNLNKHQQKSMKVRVETLKALWLVEED